MKPPITILLKATTRVVRSHIHIHLLLAAVQKLTSGTKTIHSAYLETEEKPRVITASADTADSSAARYA